MPFLREASRYLALASGWAVLMLALIVAAEVVSRKLFSFSFQAADELGGYILAIASVTGFSIALVERAHTRIDLVWARVPVSAQAILNILAYASLAAFSLYMAWQGGIAFSQSLALQSTSFTPLRTPLWIPQGLWLLGLAFFSLVCTWLTIEAIKASWRDAQSANEEFGPRPGEITAKAEAQDQSASHGKGVT